MIRIEEKHVTLTQEGLGTEDRTLPFQPALDVDQALTVEMVIPPLPAMDRSGDTLGPGRPLFEDTLPFFPPIL